METLRHLAILSVGVGQPRSSPTLGTQLGCGGDPQVNSNRVVANPVSDQQTGCNAAFSFQFAVNALTDPEGDAPTYSRDPFDGKSLPSWLTFTPATGTFSGQPALADPGAMQVRATASDGGLHAMDAVLVELEHIGRLSAPTRDALRVAKPAVVELAVVERPVVEPRTRAVVP